MSLSVHEIQAAVRALPIETPSWGYGNSGTRFNVFKHPAAARTLEEKIADAALVNQLTGACPSIALHIPWDYTDDWPALAEYSRGKGLTLGAVNANLFQEDDYKLGSLCHPDARIQQKAVAHMLECIDIARAIDSKYLSLWLPDGTNYPGQDDIRARRQRLLANLQEVYAALTPEMTLLIEYKGFEPAFYHTDLTDWGSAYAIALALGPQAKVLVDTGHHSPGTNVEYIVAQLLALDSLGGFHFNCHKYADDDLIVASSHPFELFCIFHELITGGKQGRAAEVVYMLDQSHNIEHKVEAMILSVMNVQSAYAKALCVDRAALAGAQADGDVLGAHRLLYDAYDIDVRPLLAEMRRATGLPEDPFQAFRAGGYAQQLLSTRENR